MSWSVCPRSEPAAAKQRAECGPLLNTLTSCLLAVCWLSAGCLLAVCWLSAGCLLLSSTVLCLWSAYAPCFSACASACASARVCSLVLTSPLTERRDLKPS